MSTRAPEKGNASPSPEEVERDIDAWWDAAVIPADTWGSAAFHLVAAVDDRVRLMPGTFPFGEHVARRHLIEGAFSLRRALVAAKKRHGGSVAPLSLMIDDDHYQAAARLLNMAIGYGSLVPRRMPPGKRLKSLVMGTNSWS